MATDNQEALKTFKRVSKIVLLVFLVTIILLVLFERDNLKETAKDFIQWLRSAGFGGVIVCVFVYAIATVFLFPGIILTLGTAYALAVANGFGTGLALAVVTVLFGATLGSFLAFLISRYIFRDYFVNLALTNPKWHVIDKIAETDGFKIVLLLRLCPAIPFNMLNYVLGTTSVDWRSYVSASIGMLPGIALFCYFGASLDNISDVFDGTKGSQKTLEIIFLVVGSLLAIIGVGYVTRLAKKRLNESLEKFNLMDEEDTTSVPSKEN